MSKSDSVDGRHVASPNISRKRHRRSPFCVMIQLLKLDQTREIGGDGLYLFEH